MRIKSITLRDVGPYVRETVEFSGALIGIQGPNGSGKSTLLESLYSLLTGDFRKYGNLADFVRDLPHGAKCNSGSIKGVIEHNGLTLSILRTISVTSTKDKKTERTVFKGSQKAVLHIKSPAQADEEITGVTKVDAALRELLGDDLRLLGQYAFIRQARTDELVNFDDSTRTRALHQLFRLDRYESIWKMLGDELRTIPEMRSADNLDELRQQRSTLAYELEDLQGQHTRATHLLSQMGIEAAERDIALWESNQRLREQLVMLNERLSAADRSIKLTTVECEKLNKLRDSLQAGKPAAEAASTAAEVLLAAAQENSNALREQERVLAEFRRLEAELNTLVAPAENVATWTDADEQEFSSLSGELQTCSTFLSEHATLVNASGVAVVCPTCKQPIADLAATLEQYRCRMKALLSQLTPLAQRKTELTEQRRRYESAVSHFRATHERLVADMSRQLQLYKDLGTKLADPTRFSAEKLDAARGSIAAYQSLLTELHKQEAASRVAQQHLLSAQADLSAAQASHKRVTDECSQVGEAIALLSVDHIDNCRTVLRLASEKRVQVALLSERIQNKKLEQHQLEMRIARVEALEQQIARAKLVRANLAAARDIFHREQLPMALARRFVTVLESRLQLMLRELQSDFTATLVQLDNAYQFLCHFPDGSTREAATLSGGEKVRFSISLLLAIYEVMSSRLGILALDEPTAHLDEDNVFHFIDVLSRLQRYAQNAGLQVFLVTHSPQLTGSFDQCVNVLRGHIT